MKFSTILLGSMLSAGAIASLTPLQIAQQMPHCALQCSIELLPAANCSLLDSAPCLCTNILLQKALSTCVQQNCTIFADQVAAANTETQLCEGYPIETRSQYVSTIGIVFFCLVLPFMILRTLSRWLVSRKLYADDWVAMAATGFVIASSAMVISSAQNGFGSHYWNVNPMVASRLLKLFYSLQVIYTIIQVLAKISILLFYARIFPERRFRLACNLAIAFVAIHGFGFIMALIFQCTPVNSAWDKSVVGGKCIDIGAVGYAGAAFSIFEDIVILLMPLPKLHALNASLEKRLGLMFMFSVGSFACVTSMIRLKFLASFTNDYDITYDNVDILVWSICEVSITLICACLPALRPLIINTIPKVWKDYISTQKGGSSDASASRRALGEKRTSGVPKIRVWKQSFGGSFSSSNKSKMEGSGFTGLESRGGDSVKSDLERALPSRGSGGLELVAMENEIVKSIEIRIDHNRKGDDMV